MTVSHASLTGTDLHEPKGQAAASQGMVYIADGAGSGVQTVVFTASLANVIESVTTGSTSVTIVNNGLTTVSTTGGTAQNYLLGDPTSGYKAKIVLIGGSTSLAVTITMLHTSNVSLVGGGTCITPVSIIGTSIVLEGISSTKWAILGGNTSIKHHTS